MKKVFLAVLLTALALGASAQEKETKTGWNFGPLPAVGYSTDLGLHYGVLSDIYYYGDGSTYPEYLYKFNVEASAYTKGNQVLHGFFDSKYLIPGIRVSAAISYFGNKTYSFYGFNGAPSVYNSAIDGNIDGTAWYLMRRDIFRIMTCFQGQIGDSNWGWAGGLTYWGMKTGAAENDNITGASSLYNSYVQYGVIPEAEKNGGNHIELKAGVVYDTRDYENNPSRGTNIELYAFGAPALFKGTQGYVKLAAHFKQFYPIIGKDLVFGYHLAYQGLVAGHAPYYLLQAIQSLNMKHINDEGLGSSCTIRGTVSNRFIGDGYAWGNTELRWTFAKFDWINQHWKLMLNPFFDAGMVVQPYRPDGKDLATIAATIPATDVVTIGGDIYQVKDLVYSGNEEKLHMSAGAGLHVIMNENFNVNCEVGTAGIFDPNDGIWGMSIGLNFIF